MTMLYDDDAAGDEDDSDDAGDDEVEVGGADGTDDNTD